jgi:GNAT superfamily N-acetyltransferase
MTSCTDRLLAPFNGLKVNWFDNWNPVLEEALHELPETDVCSHELFQLLIENPTSTRKRVALVSENGIPVAVVGLRQKGRFTWEPVMQWIIPGEPFPAKPGYLMRVLDALNTEVWVAWWRIEIPPPSSHLMRYIDSTPTYRLDCSDNFEQYWRDNHYFKTIRRVRNRCKDFRSAINLEGTAEWTIKNWEEKWRVNPSMMDPSLPDRILAAKYLENQGRYFTISLFNQDTLIGGATVTVQKEDLVAGVLYYEPEYRRHGLGDRLIDLSFSFAAEKGFKTFDIGGGHEYKKHWAKQDGERWWIHICPEPLYRVRSLADWTRRVIGRNTKTMKEQSHIG